MLTIYNNPRVRSAPAAVVGSAILPSDVVWIDLRNPEASETAFVEKTTGLAVPTLMSSARSRALPLLWFKWRGWF
jgi:Mg2+ and Co2+ transporter CorA